MADGTGGDLQAVLHLHAVGVVLDMRTAFAREGWRMECVRLSCQPRTNPWCWD